MYQLALFFAELVLFIFFSLFGYCYRTHFPTPLIRSSFACFLSSYEFSLLTIFHLALLFVATVSSTSFPFFSIVPSPTSLHAFVLLYLFSLLKKIILSTICHLALPFFPVAVVCSSIFLLWIIVSHRLFFSFPRFRPSTWYFSSLRIYHFYNFHLTLLSLLSRVLFLTHNFLLLLSSHSSASSFACFLSRTFQFSFLLIFHRQFACIFLFRS